MDISIAKIGFVGAGAMAKALANGFVKSGILTKSDIYMYSPDRYMMSEVKTLGYHEAPTNAALLETCHYVFLAVKPDVIPQVLTDIGEAIKTYPDVVIISVAPGWSISNLEHGLEAHCPKAKVVRVMPNTPCLVGAGACAVTPNQHTTKDQTAYILELLTSTGVAYLVPESNLDAVLGVSASGVAFVYTMIEAFSDAGVKHGLPRKLATELAVQTIYGGAMMAKENNVHPALLRDMVTSPGGTTIAGVAAIEEYGLRNAVIKGVDAAVEKSKSFK